VKALEELRKLYEFQFLNGAIITRLLLQNKTLFFSLFTELIMFITPEKVVLQQFYDLYRASTTT
jgi:hypothetical protein